MADDVRESYNEIVATFSEFLSHSSFGDVIDERIESLIERNLGRLIFNLNELREYNADFAQRWLLQPSECVDPCEDAFRNRVERDHRGYFKGGRIPRVGVEGNFGDHFVTPRSLHSRFLNHLVCVEGIVTRCSVVRPKLERSVHFCEATGDTISREYRDQASTSGAPTTSIYPTKDSDGNLLSTEFGLCTYRDYQTMTIQEMPERAPAGQLPRSIDVILEDDLVESIKPGDRVHVVGIFRAIPPSKGGSTNGIFRTVLVANNVIAIRKQAIAPTLSDMDIENIRSLPSRSDFWDLMVSSIAPSIFGHQMIKKALLLLLLGGVEKNLSTGTHIRGDMNILMVGDPSTAKSQLLRFVLHIAPLAVSTTGRGSTGVGLTAAVSSDPDTGERQLQAGAMVLADRGVVCVDEFDKMSEADRVAMHEVMEQQTVTIAKSGIHTSLNARCSVIAAANPVYGQYDPRRSVAANVGLPDSLLSRFDLLFIVRDSATAERDRAVAEHVIKLHRFRDGRSSLDPSANTRSVRRGQEMDVDDTTTVGFANENTEETPMFVDVSKMLHLLDQGTTSSSRRSTSRTRRSTSTAKQILTTDFLRKYIFFAKSRYRPQMSEEASERIANAYMVFRSEEKEKRSLPITPRTLESLIRIATSHAKCRLSREVELVDAEEAIRLVRLAIFSDNADEGLALANTLMSLSGSRTSESRVRNVPVLDEGSSDSDDSDGQNQNPSRNRRQRSHPSSSSSTSRSRGLRPFALGSPGMSSIGSQDTSSTRRSRRLLSLAEEEEEEDTQPSTSPPGKRQKTSTSLTNDVQRLISSYFADQRGSSASVSDILNWARTNAPALSSRISEEEFISGAETLSESNKIFFNRDDLDIYML